MRFPVFSPDGRWVAFWSQTDRTLKKIPVTGGVPVALCETSASLAQAPLGVSWEGDWILFGHLGGVSRVSANGGTAESIVTTKPDEFAGTPRMAGARAVVFALARGVGLDMWDTADIVAEDLNSHERKVLIRGGTDARYVPTGHMVYVVGGIVRAVPFDLNRLEVTGGAVPVILGVQRLPSRVSATTNVNPGGYFSFSNTGSLIYVPGPTSLSSQTSLALVDRAGATKPLELPPGRYGYPRVSPDGKRVAYQTDDGQQADVWVYDLSGQAQPRRLTFEGVNQNPIWSADGERIAFTSNREGDFGIWWQRVDGGAAERLTKAEGKVLHIPSSFSPDRRMLSFTEIKGAPSRSGAIWILSLGDKKVSAFSTSSRNVSNSAFSPDGHWLAYQSGNPASAGVLVEPFPPTGIPNHVARRGNVTPHHPFWSHDGKELFYLPGPNAFALVRVTTQPTFSVSNAVSLARGAFLEGGPNSIRSIDALPDGRFIAVVEPAQTGETTTAPRINVVINWFEELKRLVPVK